MTAAEWVAVVYMPWNVREAVRMLRSDMDRDAVIAFLEGAVSPWPRADAVAMGAFLATRSKDVALAVESAQHDINARLLQEAGSDDTV